MDGVTAKLASRNAHKLAELRGALPGWRIELLDAGELPPEDADTYYENALGKAAFGRAAAPPDAWVLGEDSGIEIDALAGGPGVRSARYAGPGEDQVEKLLAELARVEGAGRRARYVCELVAIAPDGEELRGSGVLEGRVAEAPRGCEGFGYDPIFIPNADDRTVAELGDGWKRGNSHRARAARALVEQVARRAGASA